jgi:hypothetical protein
MSAYQTARVPLHVNLLAQHRDAAHPVRDEADRGQGMTDQCKCGCAEATNAFKQTMTIENYVRLRRQHSQAVIDVRMPDALEFSYADHGLDDFEIDSGLLSEALTGNRLAICELSLVLLQLIVARDRAASHGGTHLVSRGVAISSAMVNQLINWMIDGLIDADDPRLPPDLIILIRHQTGGVRSDWAMAEEVRKRKGEAHALALDFALKGETPTTRKLGRALGVNPSTVVRWLPEGVLDELKVVAELMPKEQIALYEPTREDEAATNTLQEIGREI